MKKTVVLFLVVLMSFSASAQTVNLTAGEISSESIFSAESSNNWAGLAGTTEEIGQPLQNERIGEVFFTEGELGAVTEQSIEGVSYGGYYYVAVPGTQSFESSNLSSISNLDRLDANGLFGQESFPGFYPNYGSRVDAPNQTFTSEENLTLFNTSYTAASTELSGGIPFHVLEYSNGTDTVPAFVAPLGGSDPASDFGECYDGSECDYEMILPDTAGNTSSYGLFMAGSGQKLRGCGNLSKPGTSYLLSSNYSSNTSCINFEADSTLAFAGETVEASDSGCGVSSIGSDINMVNSDIEGAGNAVCLNYSTADFENGSFVTASWSFDLYNSTAVFDGVTTDTQGFRMNYSTADIRRANLASTVEIAGNYTNVTVSSTGIPAVADQVTELTVLNLNLRVEPVTSVPLVDNLGFFYPPVDQSNIAPNTIVKAETGANESVEMLDAVRAEPSPNRRFIYYPESLTSFSMFGVLGENVTTVEEVVEEVEVPVETDPDEQPEEVEVDDEAPASVAPQIRLEPIKLNLTTPERVEARKTQSKSISYTLNNTGQSVDQELVVDAQFGAEWETVSSAVDGLNAGESVNGELLVSPLESAELGNSSGAFVVRTSDGQAVAYQPVRTEVLPLRQLRTVDAVEAPQFLEMDTNDTLEFSMLVRNTGDYSVENLTVGQSGMDSCVELESSNVSVDIDETETVDVTLNSRETTGECQGAFTLVSEDNEILGFSPVSLTVGSPERDQSLPIVIPLIFLLWTAVTLREVWRDVR